MPNRRSKALLATLGLMAGLLAAPSLSAAQTTPGYAGPTVLPREHVAPRTQSGAPLIRRGLPQGRTVPGLAWDRRGYDNGLLVERPSSLVRRPRSNVVLPRYGVEREVRRAYREGFRDGARFGSEAPALRERRGDRGLIRRDFEAEQRAIRRGHERVSECVRAGLGRNCLAR